MSDLGISFAALFYGSFVGLSLGLTGGGGAVIAIPLLIYGLHFPYAEATVISLAVIGGTSLYGALLQTYKGHVLWLIGAILGLGGIPTVKIGKWISDNTPQQLLLFLFALLMTFIGLKMIFQHKLNRNKGDKVRIHHKNAWEHLTPKRIAMLLFFGGIVGVLSGTFGIGGGFFFVPILDFVLKIPIEQATATSLVGIFLIAVSGVVLNLDLFTSEETVLALQFFIGSACGMTIGSFTKELLSARTLEIIFGSFVLALAVFVLYSNIV